LVQRLQQDQSRPLLQEGDLMAKLTTILEQRHGMYREADLIIALQAGSTPEQIAELILEKIPSVLKSKAEDWRQND